MAWMTSQWPTRVAQETSQRTRELWRLDYLSSNIGLSGLCTKPLYMCFSVQLSPLEIVAQSCHMQTIFKYRYRNKDAFLLIKAYSHLMVAVSRLGHLSFVSSEFCSSVYQSFCHDWMTLTDVYKASRTVSIFNKAEESISFLSEKGGCGINLSTFRFRLNKTTEWCFITVDGLSLLDIGKKSRFKCYLKFS